MQNPIIELHTLIYFPILNQFTPLLGEEDRLTDIKNPTAVSCFILKKVFSMLIFMGMNGEEKGVFLGRGGGKEG